MDGDFRADITVSPDGAVAGRVIDTAAEEEYLPLRMEARAGAFVGLVREAYTEFLQRIADACSEKLSFVSPQANRLAARIDEAYGEKPDHPFRKLPEAAVFRWPGNRKWYGLVMAVSRSLLEGGKSRESPEVEVLNVKADPAELERLLAVPGIYPGYHMNRKNWISITLDDTVPDALLWELVGTSRAFAVGTGGSAAPREGHKAWIVPANPAYYDVDAAFRRENEILWKQGARLQPGDIVYLYVGSPASSVRYKCEVTETDIPFEHRDKNVTMKYVMRIRKLREYPQGEFSFERLCTLGIRAIRSARAVTPEFLRAIEEA